MGKVLLFNGVTAMPVQEKSWLQDEKEAFETKEILYEAESGKSITFTVFANPEDIFKLCESSKLRLIN